jgi:hygromycin-B 4-O-kinase
MKMLHGKVSYSTERIQGFLEAHYGKEVHHVHPLKGGDWSAAYAFKIEEGDYVVRFARDREAYEQDRVAAGFASIDLPIPRVEAIGEAFGGYFAISERAFGEMLDDLSREQMRRVLPALFRMLDAVRAVDLSSTRGFGGWDASGSAPYQTWRDFLLDIGNDPPDVHCHGWRASLASSPLGDSAFKEAYKRLAQLADEPPEGRHLVHGDLYCRNVLVSGDKIAAVLDWQCSVYGDFLYDIALLTYGAPWFPSMEAIDWVAEARTHFASIGLDVPEMEERLLCCQIHVGLSAQQYTVYRRQWDDVEMHAKRTLELARGG